MPHVQFRYILTIALAGCWAVAGCHAIGDPSCDTLRELQDDHCRDVLYAPDLDLTHLTEAPWFVCPPAWRPECPHAMLCPATPRLLPGAETVLALPASARESAE